MGRLVVCWLTFRPDRAQVLYNSESGFSECHIHQRDQGRGFAVKVALDVQLDTLKKIASICPCFYSLALSNPIFSNSKIWITPLRLSGMQLRMSDLQKETILMIQSFATQIPKELHAYIGLMTKQQVASHLQVSLRTIDRWLADGNLPPEIRVRVGGSVRFNAAAFERWVKSGCPKVG